MSTRLAIFFGLLCSLLPTLALAQDLSVPAQQIEAFLSLDQDENAKPADWALAHGGKAEPPDVKGEFLYYRHEGLGVWIGPFDQRSQATAALLRLRAVTRELAKQNPERYSTARAIRFRAPTDDTIRKLYRDDPNAIELRWLMENYEQLELIEGAREDLADAMKQAEAAGTPDPNSPSGKVLRTRVDAAERRLNEVLLSMAGAPEEVVRAVLLPGREALAAEDSEQLRIELGHVLARDAFPQLDVDKMLQEGMVPTQAKLLADTLREGLERAGVPKDKAAKAVEQLAALANERKKYTPSAVQLGLTTAGRELLESLAESAGFVRAEVRGGALPSDARREAAKLADKRAVPGIGDAMRVAAAKGQKLDASQQAAAVSEGVRAAAGTIAGTEVVTQVIEQMSAKGALSTMAWQPTGELTEADVTAGDQALGQMVAGGQLSAAEFTPEKLAQAKDQGLNASEVGPLLKSIAQAFGPQAAWQIAQAAGAATPTGAARDISGAQVYHMLAELGRQSRMTQAAYEVGSMPAASGLDLAAATQNGLNGAAAADFAEAVRQGYESEARTAIGLGESAASSGPNSETGASAQDRQNAGQPATANQIAAAQAWAQRVGLEGSGLKAQTGSGQPSTTRGELEQFVRQGAAELARRSVESGMRSARSRSDKSQSEADAEGRTSASGSTSTSGSSGGQDQRIQEAAQAVTKRGGERRAAAEEWWKGLSQSGSQDGTSGGRSASSSAGGSNVSTQSTSTDGTAGETTSARSGTSGAGPSAGSPTTGKSTSGEEAGGSSGTPAASGGQPTGTDSRNQSGSIGGGRDGVSQGGGDTAGTGQRTSSDGGGGSSGGMSGEEVRGTLGHAGSAGGSGPGGQGGKDGQQGTGGFGKPGQPGQAGKPGMPGKPGLGGLGGQGGIGKGKSPGVAKGPGKTPGSGPGGDGRNGNGKPKADGGGKSGDGDGDKGRGGGGSLPLPGSPIFEFIARTVCAVIQAITGIPLNPDMIGQLLYTVFPDVMEQIAESLSELEEAIASDDVAAVFAQLDKIAKIVGPLVGDITSAVDTLMDHGFQVMMKEVAENGLGELAKGGLEKLAKKYGLPPELAAGIMGLPNMDFEQIPDKLQGYAKKKVREELKTRFGVPDDLARAIADGDFDAVKGRAKDYAVDRLRKEAEKHGLPPAMVDKLAAGDVKGAFGEAYAKGARLDVLVEKGILDKDVADRIRRGDFEGAVQAFDKQVVELPDRLQQKAKTETLKQLTDRGVPRSVAEATLDGRFEDAAADVGRRTRARVDAELRDRGIDPTLIDKLNEQDVAGAYGTVIMSTPNARFLQDKGILDAESAELIRQGKFEDAARVLDGRARQKITELDAEARRRLDEELKAKGIDPAVVDRIKEGDGAAALGTLASGLPELKPLRDAGVLDEQASDAMRRGDWAAGMERVGTNGVDWSKKQVEAARVRTVDELAEQGIPRGVADAVSRRDAQAAEAASKAWAKGHAKEVFVDAGLDPGLLDSQEAQRLGQLLADAAKNDPAIQSLLGGSPSKVLRRTIRDGDLGPFLSPSVPPELRDAMTASLAGEDSLPFVAPDTSAESIFSGEWIRDQQFHASRVYGEADRSAQAIIEKRWDDVKVADLSEVVYEWGKSAGWDEVATATGTDAASLQRFAQNPPVDFAQLAQIGSQPLQMPPTTSEDLMDRMRHAQRRLDVTRQQNAYESGDFVGSNARKTAAPTRSAAPKKKSNADWVASDAKSSEGSTKYDERAPLSHWGVDYPAGTNKCNLFVHDVLFGAGITAPTWVRPSASNMKLQVLPLLAGQWADKSRSVKGFEVVDSPKPGDVVAAAANFSDASGHVGIVVPSEAGVMVASVSSRTGMVVIKSLAETFPPTSGYKPVVVRRPSASATTP